MFRVGRNSTLFYQNVFTHFISTEIYIFSQTFDICLTKVGLSEQITPT